ncbi:MAG: TIGR02444 family protein, partial [Alphaproteobacteria bacterium]
MEFPDHPLWDFSLDVYARPGVEPACLALQDDHGADINVLLAAVWAGTRGVRLTAADLDRLLDTAADWHTMVVRPLRAVRRDLKAGLGAPAPMADKLRAEVKRLE